MSDVRQKVFRVPTGIALSVGLSWDFIGSDPVDLDLSAVCFTGEGQFLDVVFFNHLFPAGTDEDALRAQYTVDTDDLPFMFLSGDSRIGGEEENQLPGIALAAKRRQYQLTARARLNRGTAAVNIFNRLYDEEELRQVQAQANSGGGFYDANGDIASGGYARRELCDEVLTFVMAKIPEEAAAIFLCVTSYTGVDFSVLPRARLVVYNESTNERVGTIDLKTTTGNGNANLACMLVRVPQEALTDGTAADAGAAALTSMNPGGDEDDGIGYWDLRELNISTYGYTFVDVLPLMFRALGVPFHSQMDALQTIPNYALSKSDKNDRHLSDVRFGVGWSGEHDLDAFMVFLDEANNYVDHIHPKDNRLRSIVASHMAQHSGDALGGEQAAGDEEFIDLVTYRVPPSVQTILVGATFQESFGPHGGDKAAALSIFDVPNFYMRLQNRSLENPYSTEVDRWDVSKGTEEGQSSADDKAATSAKEKKKKKKKAAGPRKTYRSDDRTRQPVRAVLLGALIKRDRVPLDGLMPGGRRLDQHEYRPDTAASSTRRRSGSVGEYSYVSGTDAGGPDAMVTLFEFVPIHQPLPVDPRVGFSRVIPLLQGLGSIIWGSRFPDVGNGAGGAAGADLDNLYDAADVSRDGPGGTQQYRLDREHNMAGWNPTTSAAVGGKAALVADAYNGLWDQHAGDPRLAECYGVELRFLEVLALEPVMPDRFRCHAEAWVYGSAAITTRDSRYRAGTTNRPFKSPFLGSRENLRWDTNNAAGCATFVVHQYDRIRVMLYEHASLGCTDIDLQDLAELWEKESGKDRDGRFNKLELTVDLAGGSPLYRGTVKLQICRVPLSHAMHVQKKETQRATRRVEKNTAAQKQKADSTNNKGFNPCQFM